METINSKFVIHSNQLRTIPNSESEDIEKLNIAIANKEPHYTYTLKLVSETKKKIQQQVINSLSTNE